MIANSSTEHAIQTEVALKGFDYVSEINLYRSRDGEIENLSEEEQDDEEMFACEICDGLVKESDSECPHCGAVFEDDDFEEPSPRQAPNGPSRGSPPRGPSRGGPSRRGPPGGPSIGATPAGRSQGGTHGGR